MSGQRRAWVWLLSAFLLGLVAACVVWPRTWQQIARPQTAERSLAEAAVRLAAPPEATLAAPLKPGFERPTTQEPPEPTEPVVPSLDLTRMLTAGPVHDRTAAAAPAVSRPPLETGWTTATPSSAYAGPSQYSAMTLPGLGVSPSGERSGPWGSEPNQRRGGDESNASAGPEPAWTALRPALDTRRNQPPELPKTDIPTIDAPAPFAQNTTAAIWQPPEALHRQLAALTSHAETADWARRTDAQVRRLGQAVGNSPTGAEREIDEACRQLDTLAAEASTLAGQLGGQPVASELRRAAYALVRRLDVWKPLLAQTKLPAEKPNLAALAMAVARVRSVAGDSAEGRAWQEYLMLDALGGPAGPADGDALARRREAARRVLARVAHARLDATQRRFLQSEPLARLGVELGHVAAGPVDQAGLLAALERYEQTGLPSDAQRLAEQSMWLGLAEADSNRQIAQRVALHYRNANVRIALTEAMLTRLMPKRPIEYAPVRDVVLGKPVRGESLTETAVAVRLIPDAERLRLALEITGDVAALTSSTSGPATFHNASQSHYVARKPIEITTHGLILAPAEVEQVDNVTRLRALRTAFDGIPLVESLVQGVARSQHDAQRAEVRREVKQKVALRAKERIDAEADERIAMLSERLQKRVFDPLSAMALGPTMIEATTDQERMVMRLRLASRRQLGAHTPRPRAPSDSLASAQIHQSAVNNFLERLDLAGRTLTVPELRGRLAAQLGRPELAEGTTESDDVTITFAQRDPIRVECQDGCVTVHLAVAELSKAPRAWSDFEVWVSYRPEVDGLSVRFARDDVVHLRGPYLSTASQVTLRTVFNKIFSKNRSRQLIPARFRNQPGLADVAVTQMTIADGWVALAFGPAQRVAGAPSPTGR